MANSYEPSRTVHQGRNVRRFREMLNLKQETLAILLGSEWNQRRISSLEAKEEIDEENLEAIARALKIPADAIKNFNEEAAVTIISSTLHNTSGLVNYNPTISYNSIDKLMEVVEKNEKLYTALLQSEREKNELLQKLLSKHG